MLCYPAHATHVYQGLDVVIFSVLKRYWSEERDRREHEHGEMVTKENFLAVYGAAHIRALTPALIEAVFRKTGVWPYDPTVITKEMLAPSLKSSNQVSLPIIPPTPVRVVTKLMWETSESLEIIVEPMESDSASNTNTPGAGMNLHSMHTPVRDAMSALHSTTAGFLFSPTAIHSRIHLPTAVLPPISPKPKASTRYPELLNVEPETECERLLQKALRKSERESSINEVMSLRYKPAWCLCRNTVTECGVSLRAKKRRQRRRGRGKTNGYMEMGCQDY